MKILSFQHIIPVIKFTQKLFRAFPRKTINQFILVLALFAIGCEEEPYPFSKEETFIKFFGGLANNEGVIALEMEDNGFILLGNSKPEFNGNGNGGNGTGDVANLFLVRTDRFGEVAWQRTFARSDGGLEGRHMIIGHDGSFIIVGTFENNLTNTSSMYLLKVSPEGDMEWEREFGGINSFDTGNHLTETQDNGFILIGNKLLFPEEDANNDNLNFYVVRTGPNGDMLWERSYGFDSGKEDEGIGVIEAQNLDQIWFGTAEKDNIGAPGKNYDMRLVRSNSIGNLIWDYLFGGTGNEWGTDVIQDGQNFVMLGYVESQPGNHDVYLVKANQNGEQIWARTYQSLDDEKGQKISLTTGGGYIITGSSVNAGGNTSEISLTRTDGMGNITWQRSFGGQGNDTGNHVTQLRDGGYLVTGTITFENNTMACMIKTNHEGKTYE